MMFRFHLMIDLYLINFNVIPMQFIKGTVPNFDIVALLKEETSLKEMILYKIIDEYHMGNLELTCLNPYGNDLILYIVCTNYTQAHFMHDVFSVHMKYGDEGSKIMLHYLSLFLCLLVCLFLVGLACGVRNCDLGVSNPSKSPRDHSHLGPQQPFTWLYFQVSPLDYHMLQTLGRLTNKTLINQPLQ